MRFGEIFRSSQARTALENMRPSRLIDGLARTLARDELEAWLERIAGARGADELNRLRDDARRIAPGLGLEREQSELDELIGSMVGTRDAPLVTAAARARRSRSPFDRDRIELFTRLRDGLSGHIAAQRPEPEDPARLFAFFEAYFSNFIEGTEFRVEEAERIDVRG